MKLLLNYIHQVQTSQEKKISNKIIRENRILNKKLKKEFDEIGILLPIHEFEKKMLHHLHEIDGIVLTCREKLLKRTGSAGLDLEQEQGSEKMGTERIIKNHIDGDMNEEQFDKNIILPIKPEYADKILSGQ